MSDAHLMEFVQLFNIGIAAKDSFPTKEHGFMDIPQMTPFWFSF